MLYEVITFNRSYVLETSKPMKIFPVILLLLLAACTDTKGEDTMGFMDKLFGKKPEVAVTSKMMKEDQFWRIVDKSLQNSHGQDE